MDTKKPLIGGRVRQDFREANPRPLNLQRQADYGLGVRQCQGV